MYIPFIDDKKKPTVGSTTENEPSNKELSSCKGIAGVETIKMEDCLGVSGGPLISNRPG